MPVVYFAKSYGSYTYVDLRDGLGLLEQQQGYRPRMSKAYSRDGAFADNSLHDPRRLTFTGLLTGASGAQDAASLRTAWDGFAAAHAPGAARNLQIDSDRYINARVESLADKFNGLYHDLTLGFIAFDPFWYAVVPSSATLSVGTTVVTTGGTAYSWPIFTLVVTAVGTITITNAADTSFTFTPPATGTHTIDCGAETIVNGGGTDMFQYMTGDLPILVAGSGLYGASNSITMALSGGATLSSASVAWSDRWE